MSASQSRILVTALIAIVAAATVAAVVSYALTPRRGPVTHQFTLIIGEGEIIQEVNGTEQLTGEFHRWEPPVLVVNVGDTIVLTIKNPRGEVHSFSLPAFQVDTGPLVARTGEKTVTFTANQAGTFQFICAIPYDEALGNCAPDHARMVGHLIVLA